MTEDGEIISFKTQKPSVFRSGSGLVNPFLIHSPKLITPMRYQLVEETNIEHKNEYFEIRWQTGGPGRSFFFTSNEENLEEVAEEIVSRYAKGAAGWHVIPHRKKHVNE